MILIRGGRWNVGEKALQITKRVVVRRSALIIASSIRRRGHGIAANALNRIQEGSAAIANAITTAVKYAHGYTCQFSPSLLESADGCHVRQAWRRLPPAVEVSRSNLASLGSQGIKRGQARWDGEFVVVLESMVVVSVVSLTMVWSRDDGSLGERVSLK
jgi:hypothetical protein